MLNSQQSPSQQQHKHTPNSRSPDQSNSHSYFIFDDLSSALSERNNNNSKNLINNNDNNQINHHTSGTTASSTLSSASSSSTAISQHAVGIMSALQQQNQKPPQFQHRFQYNNNSNAFHNQPNYQQFNNYHQQQQPHHHNHQQYRQKSGFATGVGGPNDVTAFHFKTLVPSVAAGAIIGKGGETIASLQKEAGVRVKMSKAHDFYPGTSERVCLISGTVDGIIQVLDFIIDKIRDKPDLQKAGNETIDPKQQQQERDKQIKILVPNSTAGMIIGKAGAYIKQIKEESGSYVQISQKPKDLTLQERCITIIGDKENNKTACRLILTKLIEDPSAGTCLNVSYADINGPVANFNPTGSPFAAQQNQNFNNSTASLNSAVGGGGGGILNGSGMNLSLNLGAPSAPTNPTVTNQLLDHVKVGMRGSGYSDNVSSEVCAALGILARYGVLGVGLSNGTHAAPMNYLGVQAMEQSANAAAAAAAAASGVYGAIGQVNLDQFMHGGTATPRTTLERYENAFDPFRHAGTQAATPISLNNNSFGITGAHALNAAAAAQSMGLNKSPTPAENAEPKNVEIPEIIVGAILGPAGRNLIEIQHVSGANIQISKKGIFAPGTRNRIVTITGASSAINMANYLIEQRVAEEESKRAAQNKAAGITAGTD